jgi:hypothetical protein
VQRDGTIQQKAVVVEDEDASSPEREDAPAAPRRAKPAAAAAAPDVADDTRTGLALVTKTPQGELSELYQAVMTDVVASVKVCLIDVRVGRGSGETSAPNPRDLSCQVDD